MYILIGDIGNTVAKLCLIDVKTYKLNKILYLDSKKIISQNFLKKELSKIFKKKNIMNIALFSCVVPLYEKELKKVLKKYYHINLREIKNKGINKIVKLAIKDKNLVGSDRVANAVGVFKKYKTNSIVLDFGTATTFDVVTSDGFYKGGIIAPGINNSIKSLSTSADQIPIFSLKKPRIIIGKNTLEALSSGFYWGYSGLINNLIHKIEMETKKKHKIILTGGYAALFKTSINRLCVIDKNITIDGVIEIYKANEEYLKK